MADIRNPVAGSSLAPQARATPARSEAVRAAQRALLEAALSGTAALPSAQPRTAPAVPAPAAARSAAPPDRILRPGSLLDIKV